MRRHQQLCNLGPFQKLNNIIISLYIKQETKGNQEAKANEQSLVIVFIDPTAVYNTNVKMAEDSSNDRPEKRCKLADGRRSTTKKDWFSSLPQSCSTNIFNYVAASPDDVMNILSFISKQSRKDCLHESIVHTIVPTIYFSSRASVTNTNANANSSSLEMTTRTMLQKLKNHQFLMGNDKA